MSASTVQRATQFAKEVLAYALLHASHKAAQSPRTASLAICQTPSGISPLPNKVLVAVELGLDAGLALAVVETPRVPRRIFSHKERIAVTTTNNRTADHPIDPQFLERWSPRAFTGEALSEADLFTMLEAARWAASSSNAQPWRFVYARRDTPHWDRLLGPLVDSNRVWAQNASALVVLVSRTVIRRPGSDQDVPSPTHSLDAGTASGYFALQANKMGWHVHGMAGFDRDRAPTELNVPKDYAVEAVYAVGRLGDPASLPDKLREREKPSDRRPLTELVFEGTFREAP